MSEPTAGVQTMLGAAGACPEIAAAGKTWKIGHPTQKAKAVLEELAASTAVTEVLALKSVLPPDAYGELWTATLRDVQAKAFRTWGPGWQRVVMDPRNSHLFLLSLLRENHPAATEEDAKSLAAGNPEEVAAALVRVVPPFFRILLDGLALTPSQRADVDAVLSEYLKTLTPPTA